MGAPPVVGTLCTCYTKVVMRKTSELRYAGHTTEQTRALERLKGLLQLQRDPGIATQEPWKRKALAKAVYSLFMDCVGLGLEQEAKELLRAGSPTEAAKET